MPVKNIERSLLDTLYVHVNFTESSDVVSKVYGSQKEGTDDQRGTR